MEQNVEVKETQPKKKRNWLFTLFACIATGVIVFLAMNIGEDLGKTVDPKTNSSNNKEVTCEEKECDCKEENTTTETNSNSNTTTNSNSNTTQQQPQTQPTATTYTESIMAGTYKLENDTSTSYIVLNKNGLYESTGSVKNGGGSTILGNYIIENNTIYLNEMIQLQNGSTKLDEVVTVKIISKDEISVNGQTYKRTANDYGMTMQTWGDLIADYIKSTER